jgi:hypothetical protein
MLLVVVPHHILKLGQPLRQALRLFPLDLVKQRYVWVGLGDVDVRDQLHGIAVQHLLHEHVPPMGARAPRAVRRTSIAKVNDPAGPEA